MNQIVQGNYRGFNLTAGIIHAATGDEVRFSACMPGGSIGTYKLSRYAPETWSLYKLDSLSRSPQYLVVRAHEVVVTSDPVAWVEQFVRSN